MTVAFSTSSPQVSVAIFGPDGKLLWSGTSMTDRMAGGAALNMLGSGLKESNNALEAVTLFLADLGPGSFTGVRVGVTLAKSLAFCNGASVGGVDAFDLVDAEKTVVLPSRRGEWFVRRPGDEPCRLTDLSGIEFRGYVGGGSDVQPQYPVAANFGKLLDGIERVEPELLVPRYILEPSISKPKQPFGAGVAR